VHFIGLVNVANLKAGGMGSLGDEQLAWLADDLKGKPASTPIVVFAHIPLWVVYADWGWGTQDSAKALAAARSHFPPTKRTLRLTTGLAGMIDEDKVSLDFRS
jgi:hypothetical protein